MAKKEESKSVERVIFFPNGNTMCFDDDGEQVPRLQRSWFMLYVAFLESKGIDPLTVKYELPEGPVTLFKVDLLNISRKRIKYNWMRGEPQ